MYSMACYECLINHILPAMLYVRKQIQIHFLAGIEFASEPK